MERWLIGAMAVAALTACQGTPDGVAQEEQAAGTTSAQNVKVVNTTAEPVPSAQVGTWSVNAAQSGTWAMSVTGGTVGISGIPTVKFQEGSSVNVDLVRSLPPVEVATLPPVTGSVSVTNFPTPPATQNVSGSVSVTNFPASQTVSGTVGLAQETTQVVYDSANVPGGSAIVDVSSLGRIRVNAQLACPAGATNSSIDVFGDPDTLMATEATSTSEATMSRVFELPGTSLTVVGTCLQGPSQVAPSSYKVRVFGRR